MDTADKSCFVIMPISDPSTYQAGHFFVVYKHFIVPACKKAGFLPIRADEVNETNYIALDVLQRIVESDMAICDISAMNPNVLYELGLRHAVRKPVSLIKDTKTDDIFDIQGIRCLEYDSDLRVDTIHAKVEELTRTIRDTYEMGEDSANSLMSLINERPAGAAAVQDPTGTILGVVTSRASEYTLGKVIHWNADRHIGVIESVDESFYVNTRFTVHQEDLKLGDEAFFIPKGSLGEGRNRVASCVLAVGRRADGIVAHVNSYRGFAFAEVHDGNQNQTKLYIQLSDDTDPIVEGVKIAFRVSTNARGVTGVDPQCV